jgi:ribosomal protein S18 acetylase RimI-like enzyme
VSAIGTEGRGPSRWRVRAADAAVDADEVGRLLCDFNAEFDDPAPPPAAVAGRMRRLLANGETEVLLGAETGEERPAPGGGEGGRPASLGLAVLRFRPAIFTAGLECYLAELYVVPDRRATGLGRALLEAALERARDRGADTIDLGTSEEDRAARALYERLGFSNCEGGPGGPVTYLYEREL